MPLEPLPETREALLSLARWSDRDLTTELIHQGELVEDIVANLVGLSLALFRDGLTFTIAATSEQLTLLDAIQYAFGGPCVDAALHDLTVLSGDNDAGLLDEQRWAEFARVGAAHGVMSTLSMPIHANGRVVAGVNLYASTPNAFAGREQRLATLLGAWAPGAVHNADLPFSTRDAAREAPRILKDNSVLDQATGVVVAARGVNQAVARQIIADAAHRAGRDELSVARELIRPYLQDDPPRQPHQSGE
jgi:GAF domain-containing protein